MSEERQTWDRIQEEPNLWYQRFESFRLLGPGRSILAVFNQWRLAKSRKVARNFPKSWRRAADLWRWRERAEAWDEHIRKRAASEAESERLRILSSGYALQHKRIEVLDELAKLLHEELNTDDKRWVPDVKSIGGGENAERVDIVRFNAPIIEQFRKTLDDLAAEMGERISKQEVDQRVHNSEVIVYLPENERENRDQTPTGPADPVPGQPG
jgi:hypothetical protein